jgi:hypothetical protein
MTPRTIRREIADNEYQPAAYIAELFHKSPQTIYGWGKRGEIRKEVRQGTTLYSLSDCRTKVAGERRANGVIAPRESIDDGKYLTMEAKGVADFRTAVKGNTPLINGMVDEIITEHREKKAAKVADHEAREEAVKMSQSKVAAAPAKDPTPIRLTAQMAPTDALGEVDRKIAERKQALLDQITFHQNAIEELR